MVCTRVETRPPPPSICPVPPSPSRLQALQFLERLCGFLLASCSVRLLGDPEPQAGPRALALALEAEALLLRGGASSLLSGEEEERPGPPDDPP